MKKELTLHLREDVIERAEAYAENRGSSLSELVEQYVVALTDRQDRDSSGEFVIESDPRRGSGHTDPADGENWREQLSPVVQSLLGSLRDAGLEESDYYRYLRDKHLEGEAS